MHYLISITLLLFAVWPTYYLVLRYSRKYTLNRVLLLLIMVAVGTFPLLNFSSPIPQVTRSLHGTIEYVEQQVELEEPTRKNGAFLLSDEGEKIPLYTSPIKPINTLPAIYAFGVRLMFLIFLVRLLFLLTLHLRSRPQKHGRYRLLRPGASPGQAFTFWRQLYFSEDVPSNPDFEHMLAHEQVHARQLHSLDVLLGELFLCAFWFHPTAWWLRTKMRANLEFLVDASIIKAGGNRRDYQLALVRQSQQQAALPLALPFSEPSLKTRIYQMTSLPKHRIAGIMAAFALFFWLGLALTLLRGTNDNDSLSSGLHPEGISHLATKKHPISAVEMLYATHYAQPLPEEFNSFELYFRRLPTPDEYMQIKSILQNLPHTNFSIYQPCNSTTESYYMQLSHFLEQEAVFNWSLEEGEIMANHFVFRLKKREVATTSIPDDLPLRSYGYYTPSLSSVPLTHGDANYLGPRWQEIAKEDMAIFINGERFHLLPKPEIKYDDKYQHAGYEKDFWIGIEQYPGMPEGYPERLADMPERLAMPPNARMACLLGMDKNVSGMVRQLISEDIFNQNNSSAADYLNGYVSLQREYQNKEIRLYLNDQPVTKSELLRADLSSALVQVGWNKKVPDQPQVLQVITDMTWH